jgi:hypothetical protein
MGATHDRPFEILSCLKDCICVRCTQGNQFDGCAGIKFSPSSMKPKNAARVSGLLPPRHSNLASKPMMFECPFPSVTRVPDTLPLSRLRRGTPLHARQRGVAQNIEVTPSARVISTIRLKASNLVHCKLTFFKLVGVVIVYLVACCFARAFSRSSLFDHALIQVKK